LDVEAPLSNDIAGYSLDFVTSPFGQLNPEVTDRMMNIIVNGNSSQNYSVGKIKINFPKNFIFTKKDEELKSVWVMINNHFLLSPPIIEGNSLILNCPTLIGNSGEVSVKIDCRVGIKTPPKSGIIKLSVSTSVDILPIETNSFFLR
jgi:hypothetical protein